MPAPATSGRRFPRAGTLELGLLPAYILMQVVPLPVALVRVLSPARTEALAAPDRIGAKVNFVSLSVSPAAAFQSFLLVCGYVIGFLTARYRSGVRWAILHRVVTFGVAGLGILLTVYLAVGGAIGSEFLPHLDEGALWVRGTLPPSTGPREGTLVANRARVILASFPEVTTVTSQVGRPDDGTDTTGFFNTEYCVDLKPKEQ